MRNTITRQNFGKLLLDLAAQKEKIQSRIESGCTVIQLAKEWNVSYSVARKLLDTLDVKHGREAKGNEPILFQNVLVVLARVCKELNINHDEIKSYL